jgi:hypothetical protein
MTTARAALALIALSLAACGSSSKSSSDTSVPSDWMDVPGMICGDGSQTGIAISHGRSDAVLVVLSPGGACWSATECNAEFKAFSKTKYDLYRPFVVPGTILDRALVGNPFSDWTVVFVPYCTGDVHAGDSTQDYGGSVGVWQHHGYRNLEAAVGAFTTTLPRPAHLVVAGSSAGGFGALAAYDLVRAQWGAPGTTAALLDDSGPTLVGSAIPSGLLAHWWSVWNLGGTLGTGCAGCETDLSAIWPALHGRHPDDRLGFVSTLQDDTMIGFFTDPTLGATAQTGSQYQANVAALATALDGLGPSVASDRIGGSYAAGHALLFDKTFLSPANPQGPALLDWVSAMVSLDPRWASTISL